VFGRLVVALLLAALGGEAEPPVAISLVPQPVEGCDQQVVVRRAVDRGVEVAVCDQVVDPEVALERLDALRGVTDLLDVGLGAPLGGERGGERVQRSPDFEEIARLLGGQVGDPGVAVRIEFDQALGLEPPQRLAERGGADPDGARQDGLVERLPGGELPGEDLLAQLRVREVALGAVELGRLQDPSPSTWL
jgi:hypothetical protein